MTYSASPKISRKLLLLGIDVSNNLAEGLVTPLPSPSPTPPLVSPHLCNDLWQWMTFNRVQYGWGKFTTRSLFLLPFPNRLELVDAPLRLFLNVNWLQNDAFRPYFPPTRNPIWPPENRKCFEINTSYLCLYYSWKLNVNGYPHISTMSDSADIVRHQTTSGTQKFGHENQKWNWLLGYFHFRFRGRHFEFQMSADVISENVGIIAGTALPALYVQSHFHCAAWANRRAYMSKGIG